MISAARVSIEAEISKMEGTSVEITGGAANLNGFRLD